MLSLRRGFILGFTLCVLACLGGCRRPATAALAHEERANPDVVPHLRDADDMGRFIAGLPATPGSPLATLQASDAWREHRRQLDEVWGKAEGSLIKGLEDFQHQELNQAPLQSSLVFYPFGGPDALTLTLCFPQNATYVMVGLEPAGTLPGIPQIEKRGLPKYLAEMRNAVDSELSRSFFVTRQMDRQFRGQITDGLLLPILHLLVRRHNTILGFRYVRLDDQGQVIDRTVDYKAPTRFGNKGVEIEFRADTGQSTHKLYYFSVNLADDRLSENAPFLTYIASLKGATTLLKATSYMTHRSEFSLIREKILATSAAILQDDSGIPFRYLQTGDWKVQLYGDYQRPYGSFRWLEQPDLRKAYQSDGPRPLSFRVGYGYSRVTSNLLVAQRINLLASASPRDPHP
jgi:hypothetical protein